jgi:hypothetical protein
MSALRKLLLAIALLGMQVQAHAIQLGVATTFNGLVWAFASNVPGTGGCTQLVADASMDMSHGTALAMHGILFCGGSNYGVSGTAYFGAGGALLLTLNVGAGLILTCTLSGTTYSGPCSAWNGNGSSIGAAALAFV